MTRKRQLIGFAVVIGLVIGVPWALRSDRYKARLPKLARLEGGNYVSIDRLGPPWHEYYSSDPMIVQQMKELLSSGIYTGLAPSSPGEYDAVVRIYSWTSDHQKLIWQTHFDPKKVGSGSLKPTFEALVQKIFQKREGSNVIASRMQGASEKEIEQLKHDDEIRDRQNGRY